LLTFSLVGFEYTCAILFETKERFGLDKIKILLIIEILKRRKGVSQLNFTMQQLISVKM